MSPTVDNKTLGSSETGSEDSEDEDEFEDLLESEAEEEEVANYKNLLTEETLKTDILRKVRQTWDAMFSLNKFHFGLFLKWSLGLRTIVLFMGE